MHRAVRVLVLLVMWQVFTRLVLSPEHWLRRPARYAFMWVSLIGISIAIGEKADVVMDYLVREGCLSRLSGSPTSLAYLACSRSSRT